MTLDAGDFRGTDRFRVLRRLGSGGMGVVYATLDRDRDEVVALKTLRWTDASAIYRLKKEFRTLADIAHPNLVALYELVSERDRWFFTMELVEGCDFLEFVRSDVLDFKPLRFALSQLAQGIAAIHQAGKLHRDLKPSNVRVTPHSRVVILDFGISADIVRKEDRLATVEEGIWGTAEYMSPEQAEGQAGPASDWYALGCMLYEAMTGRLPYTGTSFKVLVEKATEDPERPEALVAGLPPDLVALCLDLLARDPSRRPTGDEILRRLGARRTSIPAAPAERPADALLVGRETQLAELERAFAATQQGQAVTVYVHGPSGIGKSALVQRFLDRQMSEQDAVVLSGRCYVRESMPYKGLDGVIDSLTRLLRTRPEENLERLITPDLQTAVQLFPVLGRVEKIWQVPASEQEIQDPVQLRRRGFAALRELLRRIAADNPVVLHIDDLQWGDADSILLLEELLGPPAPPAVLLIASFRSEDIEAHPFLGTLLDRAHTRWAQALRVDPLSAADTRRLARHLLGPEVPEDSGTLDAIVRESAGSPFLVEHLTRYVMTVREGARAGTAGISLADMLEARIAQLPADARAFLETLAVAAGPVDALVARDVAGLAGDERPLVALLQAEHLLRAGSSAERLELYHDRIRETLAAQIDRARVPTIHLRLATSMEAHRSEDPETLYEHYLEAGRRDRAGIYAARAGDKAASALAFERAAAFYGRALDLAVESGRGVADLRIKLGEALANAGRGTEAAKVYLAAADEATEVDDALELRRRAAEQLLRCGHVDQGLTVARQVLKALGLSLARSPRHALLRLLARRALVRLRGIRFTPRNAQDLDPGILRRIDVCWSVAIGLARVDNIRAADFQTLQLLLALRAGEPFRVARALATEAGFVSTGGGRSRQRAARLVEAARTLAEQVDRPEALAYAKFAAGIASFYVGEFAAARADCEAAERMMRERCTSVAWEINTAQTFAGSSLLYLGELAELARRVPIRLREARERGDLYATADVTAGRPIVGWLMEDDVAGARKVIRDAMGPWSLQGFHLQHYFSLWAEGQIDLYAGEGLAAWSRTTERWRHLTGSMVLRVQLIRLEAVHLRARCALAAAVAQTNPEPYLRSAERDARRVAREHMPWSNPLADLVLAAVHAARSETGAAVEHARRAVAGFEAADMAAYAAAARRRLGRLIGGAQGDAFVARADAWITAQGVVNAERFTAMLAPGFPA